MKKALVSFAKGKEYISMLDVALPTFYRYCTKYDYDLVCPSENTINKLCNEFDWDDNRPASWLKIPIMKYLLQDYDYVLWVDCDVVITKNAPDICNYIDSSQLQAVVIHRDLYEGLVPNCGIWLLSKKDNSFLNNVWDQKQYIHHHWWEQMSVIHLMKWQPKSKTQLLSEYGLNTVELPYEFNVHKNDIRFNNMSLEKGYFLHATMWHNRIQTMKEWVEKYAI